MKYFLTFFATIGILVYLFVITNVIHTYLTYPEYVYQTDLTAFITAAEIFKDGKQDKLYDQETQLAYQNKVTSPVVRERLLPFRSIPLIALFYIPFTFLNLNTSTLAVFIFNLIILYVFHYLLVHNFPGLKKIRFLWLLPLVFWPSIASIIVGQHMGIMLIIYSLMYVTLYKKKDLLAGIISSLLIIRPHNLIFLPAVFFLVKKQKDFIIGLFASSVVMLLVNVISAGLPVLLQNPKFALLVENAAFGNRSYQLSSVYFIIQRIFPSASQLTLIFTNVFLYSIFLGLFILGRRRRSLEKNFLIILLITILFSIHVLSHEMISLLLPVYLLINKAKMTKRFGRSGWVLVILFFAPVFSMLEAGVVTTILLLFILIYLLVYKKQLTPADDI